MDSLTKRAVLQNLNMCDMALYRPDTVHVHSKKLDVLPNGLFIYAKRTLRDWSEHESSTIAQRVLDAMHRQITSVWGAHGMLDLDGIYPDYANMRELDDADMVGYSVLKEYAGLGLRVPALKVSCAGGWMQMPDIMQAVQLMCAIRAYMFLDPIRYEHPDVGVYKLRAVIDNLTHTAKAVRQLIFSDLGVTAGKIDGSYDITLAIKTAYSFEMPYKLTFSTDTPEDMTWSHPISTGLLDSLYSERHMLRVLGLIGSPVK